MTTYWDEGYDPDAPKRFVIDWGPRDRRAHVIGVTHDWEAFSMGLGGLLTDARWASDLPWTADRLAEVIAHYFHDGVTWTVAAVRRSDDGWIFLDVDAHGLRDDEE